MFAPTHHPRPWPGGSQGGPSDHLVPWVRVPDNRRSAVPRFYFDITEGSKFLPDEEGFDLDSLDAAEHEAKQTLVQLGRDWLPRAHEVRMQVRDERHRQVLAVSVAIKVERLEHLLEPA
jgi:uncharacterized protein DUF6894